MWEDRNSALSSVFFLTVTDLLSSHCPSFDLLIEGNSPHSQECFAD